ncbi:MAG: YraN family protein [Guyparkeria sp.]|uniref:YraN family protein n=1 Tax=Guyparkeria sp. TaxID=2035736 RepID=UPI00397E5727
MTPGQRLGRAVRHWMERPEMPWRGTRQDRGRRAEELARHHLERNGLTLLERNARAGRGEIDLVMRCDDTLVFVEVRARMADSLVCAAESISPRKCAKVRETAQRLVSSRGGWQDMYCRFDVVAVTVPRNGGRPAIDWLPDAF